MLRFFSYVLCSVMGGGGAMGGLKLVRTGGPEFPTAPTRPDKGSTPAPLQQQGTSARLPRRLSA